MPGHDQSKLRGHSWRQLKSRFRRHCEAMAAPCWICEQPINYKANWREPSAFEPDHLHPVSTHPHLALVMSNLRPAHQACNRSRGNKAAGGPWIKPTW